MSLLSVLPKVLAKPSDAKIRITRTVFALLLILVIVFGWNSTDVNISIFDYQFAELPDQLKYILFIFPFVGLVRGLFDPGLFKKSVWKKVIMSLGGLMIILSVFFLSEKPYIPPLTQATEQGAIRSTNLTQTTSSLDNGSLFAMVSTDNWMWFFGFITLLVGFLLNSKNITKKNEKHKEVIKKIRI